MKPDNVMLVPEPELPGGERVKLLDFGVAKFAEGLATAPLHTESDMLMGTPTYMAPEQCRGAKFASDRSDVYSLGVILYQLLAGRTPFVGDSAGELLAMQLADPVPPLRELAPAADARTAELIHAMLDKQPSRRPSMAGVHHELQQLESLPVSEEPLPSDEVATQKVQLVHLIAPPTAPLAVVDLRALAGRSGPAQPPAVPIPTARARHEVRPVRARSDLRTVRLGLLTRQLHRLGAGVAITAALAATAVLLYVLWGGAPATPLARRATADDPAPRDEHLAADPGSLPPFQAATAPPGKPAAAEKSRARSAATLRATGKNK